IEFALGSLVRGEWRVTDASLDGPTFTVGIDPAGHLLSPLARFNFDPDAVSIQRLSIRDGRAVVAYAPTGSDLTLDKLEFRGELRSLNGPVKGEGSAIAGGQHYPYRISTNRIGEDGGIKLRLVVDPIDRPLTGDADLTIWLDDQIPRFEGN